MRAHGKNGKSDLSHRPASFSVEKYDEWRDESLKSQFEQHFTWADIKGKPVLDFGCGAGALSAPCAKNGSQGVVGTDLSAKYIGRANEHSSHNVRFILEQATDRISVPDGSVDVILCFDVMEHVTEYQAILSEWKRLVAPGGRGCMCSCLMNHWLASAPESMMPRNSSRGSGISTKKEGVSRIRTETARLLET